MNKLTPQLELNLEETLKDFKSLIPRYVEVKNDEQLLRKFCSRNRNQIFDITNNRFFESGLSSNESLTTENIVKDHFIQRTRAVELIFEKLEENDEMELEDFYHLVKRYCSTVELTKEEHAKVSRISRKSDEDRFNWEIYEKCGIVVKGLEDLVWEIEKPNFDEESVKEIEYYYNLLEQHANISTTHGH